MTLVDLPRGFDRHRDPMVRALAAITNPQGSDTKRLWRGVYQSHINFNHEIHNLIINDYPDQELFGMLLDDQGRNSYGVCDHWTQVLALIPEVDQPPHNYIIRVAPIRRDEQEPEGGWRWHKWGPYIGIFQEQARSHEYLYDTPDVVEVFAYHIYLVHF